MQPLQCPLGVAVVRHRVCVLHFPSHVGFVFVRQVFHHVSFLMNLAALDEGGLPRVPPDRCVQRLASIENVKPRCTEVQTRSIKSLRSALTTLAFSVAPSSKPNTVLLPSQPMPKATII